MIRKLYHVYGRSYFGSGGCYGRVKCCPNCQTVGSRDNGFVSGPDGVEVIDCSKPATFTARGGDSVGDEGRSWEERGVWDVAAQAWK